MTQFVPVNEPLLNGNEKEYLRQCIDSGWISSEGPFVQQLERGMASLCGRQHGIAVSNGSVALDIAVAALGIGEGDEVIMPTFTIISCAAAIVRAGATPVLVDAEFDTWNMDTTQIEARITPRTKAIMVVHIYGLPVDMAKVAAIAQKHKLYIIEDAAEAHGLRCYDKMCGSFGDISTFSFYPNKLITTGEGGMLLTDNPDLAKRCQALRNLCFGQGDNRFVHDTLGWNARMSNLQAAVGVAQLERLCNILHKKMSIASKYSSFLEELTDVQRPLHYTDYAQNIYWVYGLVLREKRGVTAAQIIKQLARKNIGTRPFFYPMHQQPVFKKMGLFEGETYPVAEYIAEYGFYIPSGLAITNEQMEQVINTLYEILQ